MTPFEELELAPLVGAAFNTRPNSGGHPSKHREALEAIEQWWLDRPFRPWDSRSPAEARALRTAARADALARLLRETA